MRPLGIVIKESNVKGLGLRVEGLGFTHEAPRNRYQGIQC